MMFDFEVKREGRLDGILREEGNLSVKKAKDLIKNGDLRINGHIVRKPAFQVFPGDRITGEFLPEIVKEKPKKLNRELEVIFEDDCILAISKPSGLLSVPTTHTREKSALDMVQVYLAGKGADYKAYAVHRLDRDASGILLFAKGFQFRGPLMEQFKKRKVGKTYLAVIGCETEQERGEIEIPIDDNRYHPRVIPHQGKHARTLYEVLQQKNGFALIRAETRTGRRHQVRVHLAQALSPIAGDALYGKEMHHAGKIIQTRLALHGEMISFFHPQNKARMQLFAPLPKDLERLLASLDLSIDKVNSP